MDFEDFIFPFGVLFSFRKTTKALKKLGPTPHAPGAEAVQRQQSVRLPCAFSPPARYSRGQFNSCAVLWFEWWIFVAFASFERSWCSVRTSAAVEEEEEE